MKIMQVQANKGQIYFVGRPRSSAKPDILRNTRVFNRTTMIGMSVTSRIVTLTRDQIATTKTTTNHTSRLLSIEANTQSSVKATSMRTTTVDMAHKVITSRTLVAKYVVKMTTTTRDRQTTSTLSHSIILVPEVVDPSRLASSILDNLHSLKESDSPTTDKETTIIGKRFSITVGRTSRLTTMSTATRVWKMRMTKSMSNMDKRKSRMTVLRREIKRLFHITNTHRDVSSLQGKNLRIITVQMITMSRDTPILTRRGSSSRKSRGLLNIKQVGKQNCKRRFSQSTFRAK